MSTKSPFGGRFILGLPLKAYRSNFVAVHATEQVAVTAGFSLVVWWGLDPLHGCQNWWRLEGRYAVKSEYVMKYRLETG